MTDDGIIPVTVFSTFLRRHGVSLDDRDWRNLQVGLKIVKRYAPPEWLNAHERLHSDRERRAGTSMVSTLANLKLDSAVLVSVLQGFVRFHPDKKKLREQDRVNLLKVIKIVNKYT